jgi:CRISPR/Cas system-associated exonuclease Cas4 (RecB family)
MPFTYKVRQRGNFDPSSKEPFTVSRSKIDLFTECPRCFYLDQRYGVKRPDFPAFTLNNAVDHLFKQEFDIHRAGGTTHPLMKKYGVDAVPLQHKDIDLWRDALRHGVKYIYEPANLLVRGGIDDVWQGSDGKLIVVDYKATAGKSEVTLDDKWKAAYKRQAEVYQWLFKKNGFDVSPVAYFVYANGQQDREAFDGKLEFDITLLPYEGNTDWIEPVLDKIGETLKSEEVPASGECDYCAYRDAAGKLLLKKFHENKEK